MRAVILAGGLGTRLRPLTYAIPKPLLPVGEKPILEIIITRLREFGYREFILAVGYRHELLETYFRDGEQFGVQVRYVREEQRLGTAGPLDLVQRQFPFAPDETFLLMNGDILTRLDFAALRQYHHAGGYEMTIATRQHTYQLPFGVLDVRDGAVRGVMEKPTTRHDVSAGIYVLQASVLDCVPADTFFDIPDLITALLAAQRPVGAFYFEDYWLAVEQLHHIEEAQHDMAQWGEW
ncbi:MAG: NTP transferase domain-containing protein [Chloroflexi bacterium]|nr:NTP transferase domain-containing protein [Chloroflexota bacterium]MBU1747094.1 NTP transferase domain-containing protein [Chloroflexota bacterium]